MKLSISLATAAWMVALLPAWADPIQRPLITRPPLEDSKSFAKPRQLTGRFLHITDIHPDPFYKVYSSTEEEIACHRSSGPAGTYGAETSDCDSPLALVNATFKWLQDQNLRDQIDFVIWTGDSARHDNDEHIPRNEKQVIGQNKMLVDKMVEVFGVENRKDRPGSPRSQPRMKVPVVPSFGNNDILPHNIFEKGPNRWTKAFASVWRPFIPEEQRHGFDRGGWFYVEVIPGKLAVFSLNTMYFFASNSAVDGCGSRKEPGFEHMEWLRIQLQFLRERGMKAIMSGHVPPARNEEKVGWDETCWQKYALWMQQYRDVVVGSMYGHMNVEHFVLQDFKDIDLKVAAQGYDDIEGISSGDEQNTTRRSQRSKKSADDISITVNAPDYLNALRELWSKLPSPPSKPNPDDESDEDKQYHDIIGGEWAERFSLSLITASVVPNYFSTIRIYEYNITDLEDVVPWTSDFVQPTPAVWGSAFVAEDKQNQQTINIVPLFHGRLNRWLRLLFDLFQTSKKKHKKPKFTVPSPPSAKSPPGPAYSPQPFTLTGYTQYIANNTHINNDLSASSFRSLAKEALSNSPEGQSTKGRDGRVRAHGWHEGKHAHERPGDKGSKPSPRKFKFEKEYDTSDDGDAYGFDEKGEGLIMRRWIELASRIGEFDPALDDDDDKEEEFSFSHEEEQEERGRKKRDSTSNSINDARANGEEAVKRGKRRSHEIVRTWYAFVSRALTSTMDKDELMDEFGGDHDSNFKSVGEIRGRDDSL